MTAAPALYEFAERILDAAKNKPVGELITLALHEGERVAALASALPENQK